MKHFIYVILLASSLLFNTLTLPDAKAFNLSFPLNCNIGSDCFIASYVDQFYTKEHKDYLCRQHMTVNNNNGTNIRFRDVNAISKGIPVYAAASGMVIKRRDGIDDKLILNNNDARAVKSIAHGNVIIIEHDDGYKTIYSHLAKGSINVELGDYIKRGQQIGEVGLSGFTEYPHLHFEVMHNDQPVDPFSGDIQNNECNGSTENTLWEANFLKQFRNYQDTLVLKKGFSLSDPEIQNILYGQYDKIRFNNKSEKVVFWAYTQALEKGDRMVLSLFDPKGELIAYKKQIFEQSYPQHLNYIGKKKIEDDQVTISSYIEKAGLIDGKNIDKWLPGTYIGQVQLWRNEKLILDNEKKIHIN